jgi:parallel beta-helix repeat protein
VTDCTVSNNAFDGIATGAQCVVESCTATDNGDDGFSFGLGCTIRGNSSSLNGYGFYDSGGGASRVDENTAYDNTLTGFLIVGERNLVVRNMARANGAVDYSVSGSSQSGEIVVGAIMGPSTGAWANFAESVNATGAAANKASDRRSQMPRLLDRADQSVQPVAGGANVSR